MGPKQPPPLKTRSSSSSNRGLASSGDLLGADVEELSQITGSLKEVSAAIEKEPRVDENHVDLKTNRAAAVMTHSTHSGSRTQWR